MVEVWHLQLSQAPLRLLAVPRQEILLQQQVHLIAQNHQDDDNYHSYFHIYIINQYPICMNQLSSIHQFQIVISLTTDGEEVNK